MLMLQAHANQMLQAQQQNGIAQNQQLANQNLSVVTSLQQPVAGSQEIERNTGNFGTTRVIMSKISKIFNIFENLKLWKISKMFIFSTLLLGGMSICKMEWCCIHIHLIIII